jgi:hypothetical protein
VDDKIIRRAKLDVIELPSGVVVELLAVELSVTVPAPSAVAVAVAVSSAEGASYLRAEGPKAERAYIYESAADFALTAELNFLTCAAESTLKP